MAFKPEGIFRPSVRQFALRSCVGSLVVWATLLWTLCFGFVHGAGAGVHGPECADRLRADHLALGDAAELLARAGDFVVIVDSSARSECVVPIKRQLSPLRALRHYAVALGLRVKCVKRRLGGGLPTYAIGYPSSFGPSVTYGHVYKVLVRCRPSDVYSVINIAPYGPVGIRVTPVDGGSIVELDTFGCDMEQVHLILFARSFLDRAAVESGALRVNACPRAQHGWPRCALTSIAGLVARLE